MHKTDSLTSNGFKTSFFKNVLISGGFNYFSQGLTFLSSIILARLLAPENYGLVGLITVFTGFISVFSDSGISLAIIKSDYGLTYHKSLDTIALIIGVGLFLFVALMAYPIATFYGNMNLILPTLLLSTTFIFRSMSLVRGAILSKALNFNYLGKIVLVNTIITIVITITMAYFGAEHWSIIVPQVLTSIFTVYLYERKTKFRFNYYSRPYLSVSFKYTKGLIGSLIGFNLVNYWARNADNLLVGRFYGINDLGIYNRAYSLLTLPLALITGLMGTVLYPSLKKLKNEGGNIQTEYMYVLKVTRFLVFPISFLLLLFPHPLVSTLWGNKWLEVAPLLPYFGLLVFSQPLLSSVGNVLVLEGKEKMLMYSGWIGAFFTISSICFGAYFSLIAIVQYYALGFIILVLPFNVVFVYYHVLKFEPKMLFAFWCPIILISLGIWISCFLNQRVWLEVCIFVMFVVMLGNSYTDLSNLIKKLKVIMK